MFALLVNLPKRVGYGTMLYSGCKGFWWNAGVACDPGLSGLFIFWPRHMSLCKCTNLNSFWPRIFAPTGNLLGRVVSCWCFEASRGCLLWFFELECRLQTVWRCKRENTICSLFSLTAMLQGIVFDSDMDGCFLAINVDKSLIYIC